jgi:tetrahydromethanopterin S-methyltransferase subunit A
LRNVTAPEVQAFREQMQVVDMLGCENPDDTSARIEALARQAQPAASLNRAVRLSWWIARWRRAP